MPRLSFVYSPRPGRVDQTAIPQSFHRPDVPASRRYLGTGRQNGENFYSVLVSAIESEFPNYDHIRRQAQNVVVPTVLQVPDPLRIRAYRRELLSVIYAEGIQDQPGVASEGGGDDDAMDDDDNDDNDDNDDHGGYETDGDDEYGNQTDAMVDYSGAMIEMNASLSTQPLYPALAEYADPCPSRTRSFFALPVYMLDKEGGVLSMQHSSWKVFRVCESGRSNLETETWISHFIHERSYGVITDDKAARFVESFGHILLSKAKWFLDAFRNTSSSTDPAPMSNQDLAVSHLCRELQLENADDFVPHLEKTIEDLEKSVSRDTRTETSTGKQRALSSALLTHLDQESNAMEVDDDESGAYLTADRRGRQYHICKYHYKRLYRGYTPRHVETETNDAASYDIFTGKITAVLTSQDALTALLKIDPGQVGFVSESVITMDWKASTQDIDRLLEFANRFGIAAMTISGGDSEAPAIPEQDQAETDYVREILKTAVANLTRVTVIWASKLDVSALLKETSETREDILYLAIKDRHLGVLSVIYKRHLVVSRIKTDLGDLPSVFEGLSVAGEPAVSGASFLSGKAQSLEISSGVNWSAETKTAITNTFEKTIQANPALTSMVVECPVTVAFRQVPKAIEEIVRPLNSGSASRLKFRNLIVRSSTINDVVALYDLSQSSQELSLTPVSLDATARSVTSLSSILRSSGASVRVLHLIGPSPGCLDSLSEIFKSERQPDRLISLTLLLDHIKPRDHTESLEKLLVSSRKTFKQLALISHPPNESKTAILRTLETLQGIQVLLAQTATTDIEWIADATKAVNASSDSTVTVVESAEELARIVPGFTDAGLDRLKVIFNYSDPIDPPVTDVVVKLAASSPTSPKSPEGRGE
ncbi:hypothetical protein BGZ91_003610 [Linnemannia elongata]|nr:hypothetical protein BGZ91_003610 [Linnemannia elongata]